MTVTSFQAARNAARLSTAAPMRLMPRPLRVAGPWPQLERVGRGQRLAHLACQLGRAPVSRELGRPRTGQIDLDDPCHPSGPRRHHHDAIGQGDGLGHAVRDEDDGARALQPQLLKLRVERLAREGVERAERLVQQQHRRVADERPRQRRALRHAARQLARPKCGGTRQADALQRLGCARPTLLGRHPGQLQRQRHVVERRAPRHQARLLEGEPDAPVARSWRGTADGDRARCGIEQPGHQPQQRALAAAVRTDDDREGSGRDRQAALLEGLESPPGVAKRTPTSSTATGSAFRCEVRAHRDPVDGPAIAHGASPPPPRGAAESGRLLPSGL